MDRRLRGENTDISAIAGRNGYWWTKHDDKDRPSGPDPFIPAKCRNDGSGLALRAWADRHRRAQEAWGAGFGLMLLTRKDGVYDASKYVGVSFRAKVGANSTRQIRSPSAT